MMIGMSSSLPAEKLAELKRGENAALDGDRSVSTVDARRRSPAFSAHVERRKSCTAATASDDLGRLAHAIRNVPFTSAARAAEDHGWESPLKGIR